MSKWPVSVTLDRDNLLWLRGRMVGRKRRSLSDTLDEVIATARRSGHATGTVRSVVGTIDIGADDPLLERADTHIQAEFAASLGRPKVRESHPPWSRPRASRMARTKKPRRG